MNIKTKISLFFWGICASCYAQTPFTCHVKLDKPFHGKVIVAKIIDRLTGLDTLAVSGKDFTVKYDIQQAEEYRILSRPFAFDISVLAEPGCHYEATLKGDNTSITSVDGKEQNLYSEFKKQCAPINEKMKKIGNEYMKLKEAGKLKEAENALKANNELFENENQAKLAFVKAHPNTLAGMKAASEYLSMNYKEMNDMKELLRDNPYKYTYSWRSFNSKYQELADKWIENKEAPDFTTTDINGRTVRLSDFRGKTVLLDFWASWCVPCRTKMKELRKVYEQLKEKNIIVLSISLDEKRSAWEKASKEDDIIWTNTCDLKPFKENNIGKAYKVTNVPQLYVISPEGIIVTQNPSIEDILKIGTRAKNVTKRIEFSDVEGKALNKLLANRSMSFAEYREYLRHELDKAEGKIMNSNNDEKTKKALKVDFEKKYPQSLLWYLELNEKPDSTFNAWAQTLNRNDTENPDEANMYARIYKKYYLEKGIDPNIAFFKGLNAQFNNKQNRDSIADKEIANILKKAPSNISDIYTAYKAVDSSRDIPENIEKLYEHFKKMTVGNKATDFEMYDLSGKKIKLSNFKGKAVYIDCWATWCFPCTEEIPHMAKLYQHYKNNKNIVLVSISLDENSNAWKKLLKKDNPQWPQYIVKDGFNCSLCKDYNINSIPRFMLFDKKGKILSFDAPRPSEDGIIEWIDSHIR